VKAHRADHRCTFGLEIGCRHHVAGVITKTTKTILEDKKE